MQELTNLEGLTFVEWMNAATYDIVSAMSQGQLVDLTKAWERGEDPTDHQADRVKS